MPERDDLDRLLDSALVTYAEPRRGLEMRILAHVMARVEEARSLSLVPRRRWLVWGVAPLLTGCILLYVSTSGWRQSRPSIVQPSPRFEQPSAPPARNAQQQALQSALSSRAIRPRSGHIAIALVARPKLDVFPAPQALSAQEQALIALANQSPELQQEVLARAQHDDMPLQISAIQIPPISPPDKGEN
jgi:hypothetical protein